MATIKQHQIIDTSDVDDATKQHTMIELETGCMSDFPQNMIIDILSRLSVNVLCKFKLVSKDWLNLISSDPYFKKLHYAQSVRNPILLSLYPFKSSEKKKIVNATTMDKTNGLVFIPWEIDPGYGYYYSHCDQNMILLVSNERITICNPSTREIVSVLDSHCIFFTLFNHTYGFGLNPYTKEYKVARISYYEMNDKYHICGCGCQITTLPISERTERDDKYHKCGCGCQITTMPISERTDDDVVAWRCISDCAVSEVLDFYGSSVTSSGVIYWLISHDHGENYSILALDLESEKFRIISLPEDYLYSNSDMVQLVSMNGFLGVVNKFFLESATMEVWKLKDQDNVNWVKEFSTNSFPLEDDIEILGFISSDCCNDQLLIYSEQKGFFYYNFHTNTLRGAGSGYCLDSFLYFDNLFPLGRR